LKVSDDRITEWGTGAGCGETQEFVFLHPAISYDSPSVLEKKLWLDMIKRRDQIIDLPKKVK
jgi:hypothetical protein